MGELRSRLPAGASHQASGPLNREQLGLRHANPEGSRGSSGLLPFAFAWLACPPLAMVKSILGTCMWAEGFGESLLRSSILAKHH